MILYNKRNTYSFRNHVVTAHKRVFSLFYIDGCPKVMAGDDAYSLDGSVQNPLPLSHQKIPNDK